MRLNNDDSELLLRVEGIIDALEMRGITSAKFFDLCAELDGCLKSLPTEQILQAEADDDMKSRFISLINRLKKLETFAGAQAGITSSLNQYIADPDK